MSQYQLGRVAITMLAKTITKISSISSFVTPTKHYQWSIGCGGQSAKLHIRTKWKYCQCVKAVSSYNCKERTEINKIDASSGLHSFEKWLLGPENDKFSSFSMKSETREKKFSKPKSRFFAAALISFVHLLVEYSLSLTSTYTRIRLQWRVIWSDQYEKLNGDLKTGFFPPPWRPKICFDKKYFVLKCFEFFEIKRDSICSSSNVIKD